MVLKAFTTLPMSVKLIFESNGALLPRSMARTFGGAPLSGGAGSCGIPLNLSTTLPMSVKFTVPKGIHTSPHFAVPIVLDPAAAFCILPLVGIFAVNVEIAKPTGRPSFVAVRRIMVDTGSEMTWIAQKTLRSIRLDVRKKDQTFIMKGGQQVTRNVGYAIIRCGEFETIDEVVFAQAGDLQLLGARTLEGFNAVVDSRRKRLVAAGAMPAAACALLLRS